MKKAVRKKTAKKKAVRKKAFGIKAMRLTVPKDLSEEIDRRFDFVSDIVPWQTEACVKIRSLTKKLAREVARNTPICREQSLAITKLEEALHFAIAAIVRPRGDH